MDGVEFGAAKPLFGDSSPKGWRGSFRLCERAVFEEGDSFGSASCPCTGAMSSDSTGSGASHFSWASFSFTMALLSALFSFSKCSILVKRARNSPISTSFRPSSGSHHVSTTMGCGILLDINIPVANSSSIPSHNAFIASASAGFHRFDRLPILFNARRKRQQRKTHNRARVHGGNEVHKDDA